MPSATENATETQDAPLAGLRVLEFTQAIMGPSAGLVLADLGADVIKVEPAPGGDPTRRLSGFAAGFFGYFNRNKRSIAIDIKDPEGLALVHRLLRDGPEDRRFATVLTARSVSSLLSS